MNLFFRMWWVIFQAKKASAISFLAPVSLNFRVWLHDLGWRDHLPNYRVFSFMELGRFALYNGSRMTQLKEYGFRMIAAQDFIYLRPIGPFQKFEMTTELLSYDEKYFYFRHNFLVKNKLVGIGLVKEASVKIGKVIPPALLVEKLVEKALENAEQDFQQNFSIDAQDPIVKKWMETHQLIKASNN